MASVKGSKDEVKFDAELLDQIASQVTTEAELQAVLKQLSKKILERALEAEMTEHLGHDAGGVVINPSGNTRNGKSKKKSTVT